VVAITATGIADIATSATIIAAITSMDTGIAISGTDIGTVTSGTATSTAMRPTTADAACTCATGARIIGVGAHTSSTAASAIAAASLGPSLKRRYSRGFPAAVVFLDTSKPGICYIYSQRIIPCRIAQ
jgi:hypothetical protein